MEVHNKINYFDVLAITKMMCTDIIGKEHEIVSVPMTLEDEGELRQYTSVFVCDKDDKEELLKSTQELNGVVKEEYNLDKKYCHITTYESKYSKKAISFDSKDSCPIKANFNEEYSYIEDFFKKFIGFRNNLLKVHQVVKADDIYQYYYCYNKRRLEREHEDRSLKELAKKYMSSR